MPKRKSKPPIEKHKGHNTMLVRLTDKGPHKAMLICRDCDGAWIKWVSVKNA